MAMGVSCNFMLTGHSHTHVQKKKKKDYYFVAMPFKLGRSGSKRMLGMGA